MNEVIRHCGYCLMVCPLPAKLCSGCKRRAYCSRECQQKDWTKKGNGQGHANWCRHYEYGEEDVDWEVAPVPNKGLGIVAKRLILAGYRILIEPVFTDPKAHPEIMNLEPKGASLQAKFELNQLIGHPSRDGGKNFVGLRISRMNHDCRPNAGYSYDETARAEIVFAQRDIQPGEEICISYFTYATQHYDITGKNLAEQYHLDKKSLVTKHGVICPKDCSCNDPSRKELNDECGRLYTKLYRSAATGLMEEALDAGEKILDLTHRLNSTWFIKAALGHNLFEIASTSSKLEARAERYFKDSLKVWQIIAPYSEMTKTLENLWEHHDQFKMIPKTEKIKAVKESFAYYVKNGMHGMMRP